MQSQVHAFPIVQSGALEFSIVNAKPKRFNQVQRAAGRRAEPGDVAGIGRNLRLDKDDVQRRRHGLEEGYERSRRRCDDVRDALVALPNPFDRFARIGHAHFGMRRIVDQAISFSVEAA